jgi:23S rRNA (adenine2503-C2)-methyltransferase
MDASPPIPRDAIALRAIAPEALARAFSCELGEARKIISAAHRDLPLGPLVGVRRATMDIARARGVLPTLRVIETSASRVDPFVKYVVQTHDGEVVETVRIPLERAGRFSVCVSSQAGCALACTFCATGRLGLKRNLETWEIIEQVRIVRRGLADDAAQAKSRVHGVVFQGMGEPMANFDHVLEAIAVMCEPSAMAIDARCMTVCTSGLPTGIRRLAREAPKVRLAISIGSARSEVRRTLMPIDRAHSLDEVMDAAVEHAKTTGLAPMWAVTPLAGVNDSSDDAHALADRAIQFAERAGVRPRISVIPYNSIGANDPFTRASDAALAAFRDAMSARGVHSHRRYSGEGDIAAACGQLAGVASPVASPST